MSHKKSQVMTRRRSQKRFRETRKRTGRKRSANSTNKDITKETSEWRDQRIQTSLNSSTQSNRPFRTKNVNVRFLVSRFSWSCLTYFWMWAECRAGNRTENWNRNVIFGRTGTEPFKTVHSIFFFYFFISKFLRNKNWQQYCYLLIKLSYTESQCVRNCSFLRSFCTYTTMNNLSRAHAMQSRDSLCQVDLIENATRFVSFVDTVKSADITTPRHESRDAVTYWTVMNCDEYCDEHCDEHWWLTRISVRSRDRLF